MKKIGFFLVLGLLLIAAALSQIFMNISESEEAAKASAEILSVLKEEIRANESAAREESAQSIREKIELPEQEPRVTPSAEDAAPSVTVDGLEYIGVLDIPALELSLPVMKDWDKKKLKSAPCRFAGSAENRDLVVCAHNYPSHFESLSKLKQGDKVVFTDARGEVYGYVVDTLTELTPAEISASVAGQRGEWDMMLFTCTLDGKARVAAVCVRDH